MISILYFVICFGILWYFSYGVTWKYQRFAREFIIKNMKEKFILVDIACYGFGISREGNGVWSVYVKIFGEELLDGWTNGTLVFNKNGELIANRIVQRDIIFKEKK